jgi:hypothetical protein
MHRHPALPPRCSAKNRQGGEHRTNHLNRPSHIAIAMTRCGVGGEAGYQEQVARNWKPVSVRNGADPCGSRAGMPARVSRDEALQVKPHRDLRRSHKDGKSLCWGVAQSWISTLDGCIRLMSIVDLPTLLENDVHERMLRSHQCDKHVCNWFRKCIYRVDVFDPSKCATQYARRKLSDFSHYSEQRSRAARMQNHVESMHADRTQPISKII